MTVKETKAAHNIELPPTLQDILKERGISPKYVAALYIVQHQEEGGDLTLASFFNPELTAEDLASGQYKPEAYYLLEMLNDYSQRLANLSETLGPDESPEATALTDEFDATLEAFFPSANKSKKAH